MLFKHLFLKEDLLEEHSSVLFWVLDVAKYLCWVIGEGYIFSGFSIFDVWLGVRLGQLDLQILWDIFISFSDGMSVKDHFIYWRRWCMSRSLCYDRRYFSLGSWDHWWGICWEMGYRWWGDVFFLYYTLYCCLIMHVCLM
jgi:hypothetical protein